MTEPSPYFIRRASQEDFPAIEPIAEQRSQRLDLWGYVKIFKKHFALILSITLGLILITAIRVIQTPPTYTAEATVLIRPKVPQILDLRGMSQDTSNDSDGDFLYDSYYKTQYEILRSRSLAASVIRNDNLANDPVFSGKNARPQPGPLSPLKAMVAGFKHRLLALVGHKSKPVVAPPAQTTSNNEYGGVSPGLIGAYLGALHIDPIADTSLVRIGFVSTSPQLAARLANDHAEAYIRQGVELHSEANVEAQRFLEQRLIELKDRLEKSETALNNFRRDKGIVPGLMSLDGKENLVVDRLTDLSKDLTRAQVERIGLEAQVTLIRKRDYDSLPAVRNNATIGALKEEAGRLQGEYASMAKQFKPDFPPLLQLRARLDDTNHRLQEEVEHEVQSIESSFEAAATKEKSLQAELDHQRSTALTLNDAAVQYAILQREVDTNRQLYNSVLQRLKDIGVEAGSQSSNVSVIDSAEVPSSPSAPKRGRSLAISTLVGLSGGLGLAFLLEFLDNTLKDSEDVEAYLNLPSLGLIPDLHRLNGKVDGYGLPDSASATGAIEAMPSDGKRELVLYHGPYSVAAEAYRALRTGLLLSRAGEHPRTTLFTSALPSEGKTTTAVNTALILSQMGGVRVLLVDADLRHPRCHKVLGVENGLGLTEVLTGYRDIEELINPTSIDHLFFLTSGSLPPNSTELLGSRKMRDVISQLRQRYDYVVIDSPPVMPVSDSVMVSTMVDGVVLVVDRERTPRQIVKAACTRLNQARAKILGVVLNKIKAQGSNYNYYGQYYYYGYNYSPESEKLR